MVFCGKLVENKGLWGIGWWVSGVDKGVDNVDKLGKLLAKRGMADW